MEPRRRQPPEVPGTLPEGDRRHTPVQEPRKGVSFIWQKAQAHIGRRHKVGRKYRKAKDRLRVKARLEKRVEVLISARYKERNCLRFVKRLKREKGMLFTFLEKECDWHNNNAAERAIRPSVAVRKVTYGNRSITGAKAHAVLMSIRETCKQRRQNFYGYALDYPGNPASKR